MGRTESTVRAGESGESGGRTEERRVASVTCESVRRVTRSDPRSRSEDARYGPYGIRAWSGAEFTK